MSLNELNPAQRRWFNAIRDSLSRDLLSPKWRKKVPVSFHTVCGHCYIATEAAFHAFGR